MELVTVTELKELYKIHKEYKLDEGVRNCLYHALPNEIIKVDDIYESDISFSFRVFCQKQTRIMYQFYKK